MLWLVVCQVPRDLLFRSFITLPYHCEYTMVNEVMLQRYRPTRPNAIRRRNGFPVAPCIPGDYVPRSKGGVDRAVEAAKSAVMAWLRRENMMVANPSTKNVNRVKASRDCEMIESWGRFHVNRLREEKKEAERIIKERRRIRMARLQRMLS